MTQMSENHSLAQVKERSIGVLFFAVFGGLWLLISLLAFGLLTRGTAFAVVALTVALIATAYWLIKSVPRGIQPDPQRERDGSAFAWVNAAQGIAIFLVFLIANKTHHPNVAFDLTVLIVGVHMFALPRSYRIPSNLITGALLVLASILCPLLFRGDVMVGAVTLCAGLTLWCSAAWKLRTAIVLLRTSRLEIPG